MIHVQFRKDKLDIVRGCDDDTIYDSIATHLHIPRQSLKLVAKAKMLSAAEAEQKWVEEPSTVFFVVGVPVPDQEWERRQQEQARQLQKQQEQQAQEEAARLKKEDLAVQRRNWAAEEEARLEQEARDVVARREQRRKQAGPCTRLGQALVAGQWTDGLVAVQQSSLFLVASYPFTTLYIFFASVVSPPPPSEEEDRHQWEARQREAEATGVRRRGMGRIDHQKAVSASMGG